LSATGGSNDSDWRDGGGGGRFTQIQFFYALSQHLDAFCGIVYRTL
jgi:hypothetical protein